MQAPILLVHLVFNSPKGASIEAPFLMPVLSIV